ncbi:o-succinylbenzoate synthase [Fictibacillus terranigra]|uniref:o-succinylbenzoate synthase n=1 Tax=Fictibacillus terranigra TaxID=3058424 RepID=A0ABT8EAY7_9BACL|nr:o-succinylbenzoate synthase [Fictibacillus sp. CENA-BCM004]MDN4075088.1 o-succinylbenzoate synthase [Fictibacillus sp. CENA-BCM004]
MKISQVILRHMKLDLLHPFTTSFATEYDREFILVEVRSEDGTSGWAESVAMPDPVYNEETVKTNWHMLEDYLIPILLHNDIQHPDELTEQYFAFIKGNYMAKAAIEGAVWDLYAKKQNQPLSSALGGTKKQIEVGVSIGIKDSVAETLKTIESRLSEGYKRFKLKIKPGWDIELIEKVRSAFPDIPLMADANSAYTLNDVDRLRALDDYQLMMIEQPLAYNDIIDHADLQAELKTPICLDESIHSLDDARKALKLGSCKIINIKIGRVGGLTQAKKIHDLCQDQGIPVWCGGMLESGVGRAHNIAITTLPNFVLPGDTAASSLYWADDIIEPEVTVENGWISVPDSPGIGYQPSLEKINKYTTYSRTYRTERTAAQTESCLI